MNGLVVSSLEAYHLRQLLDSQDSLNLTLETLRTRLSTNSDTQIPSAEEDFTITSREEPSSLAVVTVSCPIQQSASSCSDSASPTLAPSSPRLSPSDKDGDKGSGFSTAEKSTLAAGSSMNPDVSMDNVSTTSTPSSPTSFFTWSLETGETSNQDYVSGTKSGLKRSCPWGSDAEEEQGNYGYDDEEEGEDEGTGPANRMRGGAKICPRKSRALRSAPKTTIERRLLSRGGPEGLGNQNDLEDIRMQHDPPPAVLNGAAVSSGEHSQIAPGMESLNCVPAIPDPPIPENPVLNTAAITFISAIASVCRDFVHDAAGHVGIVTSVPALMQSLLSVESAIVIDDSSAPEMNGLIRLAVSCIAAEVDEAEAHLHYYLSSMMFASGINRELQKPNTYKYQLLDQIASKVKFRRRSGKIASYTGRGLERYLADGIKVAALCAAGSFNMVIFLSCTRMRAELRKIPAEIFLRLTKAIRCPPNSALGRLIARDVITAVQYSFQLYLIKLHMLFPTRFLEQKYGSSIVDCTDLCATDEILEGFFFNDFVKVRDLEAWKPALQPLQPASNPTAWILPWTLPSIHSSPRASDLVVINTNYDPTLNTKTFYPKTQQGRFDYTEEQRKYVSQAASCSSIDDFREKISKQLQTGKKKENQYICLPGSAVDGQMVRLNDVNQNLLALIVATMPLDLRARLLDIVNLSFAQGLRFVDSKLEGFLNIHHSVHLSRYNRFAFQGDGKKSNIDPVAAQREGKKRYVNTSQFIPRVAQEMNQHVDAAEILNILFEPVYRWIRCMLIAILPKETAILRTVIDILPGGDNSEFYPFTSCVLNLNVCTSCHRDAKDKIICLVLVVQSEETVGGELCLLEPGVVLALRNGDLVVFPSGMITHFNGHIVGYRASLVFQTDKEFDQWVLNRNGWAQNSNFKSCQTFSYYSSPGGGYDDI